MLDEFNSSLAYSDTESVVFNKNVGIDSGGEIQDHNVRTDTLITATDLSGLIAHLTDPNQINNLFIADLLMTHRIFVNSVDLLQAFLKRLDNCFDYAVLNTDKFENELQQQDDRDESKDEERFNALKKIMLRLFVILRSWLLNYFVDDWLPNYEMRKRFVDYLNSLSDKYVRHSKHNLVDKFYIKLIISIKKVWIEICYHYWNQPSFLDLLRQNGLDNKSVFDDQVIKFMSCYKLNYGPQDSLVNVPSTSLFQEMEPRLRNSNVLLFNSLMDTQNSTTQLQEKRMVTKKSFTNNLRNMALLKPSNSITALKVNNLSTRNDHSFMLSDDAFPQALKLSKSKVINNLNQLSPVNLFKPDSSQLSTLSNEPLHNKNQASANDVEQGDEETYDFEAVLYNTTMFTSKCQVKLLNFNLIKNIDQGKLISGKKVQLFDDYHMRDFKTLHFEPAQPVDKNGSVCEEPSSTKMTDIKDTQAKSSKPVQLDEYNFLDETQDSQKINKKNGKAFKTIIKKWRKNFSLSPKKHEVIAKANGDKRLSQIVNNLLEPSKPKPLSPIRQEVEDSDNCDGELKEPAECSIDTNDEVNFTIKAVPNNDSLDTKMDFLSAKVIDELHYLVNNKDSGPVPEITEEAERSLLSNIDIFRECPVARQLSEDLNDSKSSSENSNWIDETDQESAQTFNVNFLQRVEESKNLTSGMHEEYEATNAERTSFISVAEIDWNNDSLKFGSSNASKGDSEGSPNATQIIDVTPSMIMDGTHGNLTNAEDYTSAQEDLYKSILSFNNNPDFNQKRYSGSIEKLNRYSRSSLVSKNSYISYDSNLTDSPTLSILFLQRNMQAKHLKPKVLEKVKSFEKLRIELEKNDTAKRNALKGKKSFNNLKKLAKIDKSSFASLDKQLESSATNNKIRSKINFFQETLMHNANPLSTFDINSAHNGTASISTRKNSMVQNSLFSENGTLNTLLSSNSDISNSNEDLFKNIKHSIANDHSALKSKAGLGNIKAFINGNTINESNDEVTETDFNRTSPSQIPRSETVQTQNSDDLIQTVMDMESLNNDSEHDRTSSIDCSPLKVCETPKLAETSFNRYSSLMKRDKSDISMLSVASYLMPGINSEIVKRLAAIPDESFHGEDPVSAALAKLEGKFFDDNDTDHETNGNDNESLVHKRKLPSINLADDIKETQELHERKILQVKRSPQQIASIENFQSKKPSSADRTIEDEVADLNINDTLSPIESQGGLNRELNSRFFQAFGSESSIFDSAPDIIKKMNNQDSKDNLADVLSNYRVSNDLMSVSEVMCTKSHIPFVLEYSSSDIANELTLIEKDAMLEIDWKELMELNKKPQEQSASTETNFKSWVEILVQKNLSGLDLVIYRFNLVINWIVSEILLTNDFQYRVMTICKFINVAKHCLKLQNYSSMMQIVLALTSERILNLPNTWESMPSSTMQAFKSLEEFVNPMNRFEKIKQLNENIVASKGCIPFIGLYLSELKLALKQPNFVSRKDACQIAKLDLQDPTTVIIVKDKKPATDGLIFWQKFHKVATIVKVMIQKIQYSKFYNFAPLQDLLSRCLYIRTLNADEMNLCISNMTNP